MLKKGDVLAFQSEGSILGNAITLFQSLDDWKAEERIHIDPDRISHVALVLDEHSYIEADVSGVRIVQIDRLPADRIIWHCVLTDKNRKKIYDNYHEFTAFLQSQKGKRYDFRGIVRIALNILSFGLYNPPENNRYNFCSELIYAVFKKVGMFHHDVNSSLKTPSMLFTERIFKERRIYVRENN